MKRFVMSVLLLVAFVIALPISNNPQSVALAGRTQSGDFCVCGCTGCLCAPDEEMQLCIQSVNMRPEAFRVTDTKSLNITPPADLSNLLFIAFTFLLVMRYGRT